LPKTVRVTHRFTDTFTLIAPRDFAPHLQSLPKPKGRLAWLAKQNWLLIDAQTRTGGLLRSWMRREGWRIEPTMHLDNFDLIINLVSLGMGVSFVPIRALALYNQRRRVLRVSIPSRFRRELVVVVRKHRKIPDHLNQFIANVLF
jgi:DNA-binding transcriptional LysR family regulator